MAVKPLCVTAFPHDHHRPPSYGGASERLGEEGRGLDQHVPDHVEGLGVAGLLPHRPLVVVPMTRVVWVLRGALRGRVRTRS